MNFSICTIYSSYRPSFKAFFFFFSPSSSNWFCLCPGLCSLPYCLISTKPSQYSQFTQGQKQLPAPLTGRVRPWLWPGLCCVLPPGVSLGSALLLTIKGPSGAPFLPSYLYFQGIQISDVRMSSNSHLHVQVECHQLTHMRKRLQLHHMVNTDYMEFHSAILLLPFPV